MSFKEDLAQAEKITKIFCIPIFTFSGGLLIFSLFL
tara:strand:- start:51 stop:158 length:108 start_codon:yes stop_codon:yes gene_type:complete